MSFLQKKHQIVDIVLFLLFLCFSCKAESASEPGIRTEILNDKIDTCLQSSLPSKNFRIENLRGTVKQPLTFYFNKFEDNGRRMTDSYTQTKQFLRKNGISLNNKNDQKNIAKNVYLNENSFERFLEHSKLNGDSGKKIRLHKSKRNIFQKNNVKLDEWKNAGDTKIKRTAINASDAPDLKNKFGLQNNLDNISNLNANILVILSQLLNTNTTDLGRRLIELNEKNLVPLQKKKLRDAVPISNLQNSEMLGNNIFNKSKLSIPPSLGTCKPSSSSFSDTNESPTRVQCYQTNVNIDEVLLKVLQRLDTMQNCQISPSKGAISKEEKGNKQDKPEETTKAVVVETTTPAVQPEDVPCNLKGSWNSHVLGLRFIFTDKRNSYKKRNDTIYTNPKARSSLRSKRSSTPTDIEVTVTEKHPPKQHEIMDTKWKINGNTLNMMGGPFYLNAMKENEKLMGTFLGYCRTCGGVDTIFGSWAFIFPSKDCQDISTAVQNRRDILRRDRLEEKLKEQKRFKKLKQKRFGNKNIEIPKNCDEAFSYE